ncbi:MAG: SCP2 sterol-binding domain-containing protein [Gemmatimonadales bacterium]|nr:SCP2 sterol-binding domain-containing protein [Gemmatimonadales bacterium]
MTDPRPAAAATAHPAFSAAWAEAWGRELNANPTYQQVAARWEGDIVLEMSVAGAAAGPAIYLDLWHGVCRAARAATEADHGTARYLFQAPREAWRQVLGGKLSPAMAILTGKLRLARGSLADFLPYASAAEELLRTGGAIEATFPDD